MPKLTNLNAGMIDAYKKSVEASGSMATAKRKLASLKKFTDWAHKQGYVDTNPFHEQASGVTPSTVQITSKQIKDTPRLVKYAFRFGVLGAMVVIIFLLLGKLNFPIPFIKTPASEIGDGVPRSNFGEETTPNQAVAILSPWTVFAKMKLTAATGGAVTSSQAITFKLYDKSDATTPLWTSEPKSVDPDTEGIISIQLSDVPTNLFFENKELYLSAVTSQGEIDQRIPVSTASSASNLSGYYAGIGGADVNSIPVISGDGSLIIAAENPSIKATAGNLLVEGQAVTLITKEASDGDIEIAPDGTGIVHFLFEGTGQNYLNAQAPNLASGSLYYGIVANNNTGYDLLRLQSGSKATTKASIDALGNAYFAGNLNVDGDIATDGVTRLTEEGNLTNISGYSQTDGNFSITQDAGDTATITKNESALSSLLTLTLDERNEANSKYSTLVLNRYNGSAEAAALHVDEGSAIFDGQVRLGQFTSNPDTIGAGSLVFNTTDNVAYVWNGTSWIAFAGSGTNADTLDSLDSTQFLRSDTSDNFTSGTLTTNAGTTLDVNGDLVVSDTNIAFDGASTTFTTTGDLTIDSGGGDVSLGASDNLGLTAATNLIFGGVTSLGETTAANDSGAYLVGAYDEFDYSDETNVQGVLNDIDSTIAGIIAGTSGIWTDAGTVTYLTSTADDLAVGGTTLAASIFGIDESTANFYFGYDNTANPTLNFEATDGDAGEFGFNTNDSFYFSNANVGIGTTSPGAKLDISVTSGSNALQITNSSATTNKLWVVYPTTNGSSTDLRFYDTADRMTLQAGGNVGIGTVSPNYKLEVNGTIGGTQAESDTISSTNAAFTGSGAWWWLQGDLAHSLNFGIYNSGSQLSAMTITQTGNVGIGDTTPDAKLDFDFASTSTTAGTEYGSFFTSADTGIVTTGTDTTYGTYDQITRTGATGGTINTYGEYINLTTDNAGAGTHTATGLAVALDGNADNNYAATFTGGNVGIGTTSPTNLLSLRKVGVDASTPGIDFYGTQLSGSPNGGYGSGRIYTKWDGWSIDTARLTLASPAQAGTGAISWTDVLNIKNGNVGIGDTDPDAKLEILSTTTPQLLLTYTDGTVDTGFSVDSGGDLTINASGGQVYLADTDTLNVGGLTGVAYNAFANSGEAPEEAAISSDNDLYIGGDLEVDGTIYGTFSGDVTCTDCLDFVDFEDTLDLDTDLILNQGTSTWTQNFTGDTTVGLTYNANSLTTGTALALASTATAFNGELLTLSKTGASGSTAFTSDIANITYSQTFNGGVALDSTGNVLDLTRAITLDNVGNTHTVSGAGVTVSDTGTQTAGTLTWTGDTMRIAQNYAGANSSALNITTASTDAGTSNFALRVNDDGTFTDSTPFVVDEAGNVGIGTTTPGSKLDVNGISYFRSVASFYDTTTFSGWAGRGNYIFTGAAANDFGILAANNLYLGTNNSQSAPKVTIDTSGDLGIGDTTPDAKLEVLSTTTPQLLLTYTDGTVDTGFSVDSGGDLTINASGGQVYLADTDTLNVGGLTGVAYNAFANAGEAPEEAAIAADNDLYIGGDLEVDGTIYGTFSATDLTCTDCLDFTDFEDTLDLDADLTLNQDTYAWTQNYTGTTGTGLSYVANSLTTGEALDITASSSPTDGSTNEFIDINLTNSPTTLANASQGINLSLTDATALADTLYGTYVTVDNSANTSTGTHTIYGGYYTAAGKTAGTTTAVGLYSSASGADNNYAAIFENGNVGIGTTSPGAKLHLSGPGVDTANIRLTNSIGAAGDTWEIQTGISGIHDGYFGIKNIDSGTQAIAITPTGNVGIGTTAPDARLEINHATGDNLRLTYNDSNGSATAYTDLSLGSDGDLTIDSAGGQLYLADTDTLNVGGLTGVAYNAFANSGEAPEEAAISSDNDLYIGGDLEVDGTIYGTFAATDLTCTDCLDFTDFEDTLDLDADLTLNQGTSTWTQNFDGTTTTGLTYNADSLTSGNALSLVSDSATASTAFTGDVASIAYSPTYTGGVALDTTGNVLDISRSTTLNNVGNTLTVSGAVASISDSGTQTAGTLTSTADVLRIAQNYTGNTGSALDVTSAGGATGFALRVNDDGTFTDSTPFVVTNAGDVGIGTTTPAAELDVRSTQSHFGANGGNFYVDNNTLNFAYTGNENSYGYINYEGYQAGTTQFRDLNIGDGKHNTITFFDGSTGNVGIGTTAPDARLEINHATGDNLRLTYNDADGTAANYTDFSLSSSGDLTIDSSGGQVYLADTDTINIGGLTAVAYNALANVGEAPEEAAISSDNDLYIGGDLEVDGTIYGTFAASDLTCTDCLDFTDFEDTLDLDAALTLNQTTNTWTQTFTGDTTVGLTYNANSLTTGSALALASTATSFNGELLTLSKTGASGSTAFTSDIANVTYSQTFDGGVALDSTGNVLDISRAITLNNLGNTHTVSGAGVTVSDTGTQTAGTLTWTGDTMRIAQNYAGANSAALNITTASTDAGTSNFALRINDDGTFTDSTPFVVDEAGNVGIGTTSPGVTLDVVGPHVSGTGLARFTGTAQYGYATVDTTTTTDGGASAFRMKFGGVSKSEFGYTTAGGESTYLSSIISIPMVFKINNTEVVRIDTSGNTGIGTTAPDARLEINHATGDNLRLTYNDADGTAANYTDFSLSSSGDLTIDSSGGQVYLADTDTLNVGGLTAVAYNAFANSGEAPEEAAISSDNDLYIGGDLEVDGTIYGTISGDLTCTDCLDFVDFEDTLDLDTALTLNQGGSTWIQNFDGATTTGLTYNADSLTSGKALSVVSDSTTVSTAFTGDVASIAYSPTYTGGVALDTTGNLLDISRSTTLNNPGNTLTVSGAVASISDSGTFTAGTLTSTADVLRVAQNYTTNTGSALDVTSAGGATGFALRVNDDGTFTDSTPFVVTNAGDVGIGTTTPGVLLDVRGGSAKFIYDGADVTQRGQILVGADTDPNIAFQSAGEGLGFIGVDSSVDALVLGSSSTSDGGIRIRVGMSENTWPTSNLDGTDAVVILENGNVGIGSTAPDARLEINHATGDNLRLTYNDADGTAANYTDFSLSSSGDLTIDSSGGQVYLADTDTLNVGGLTGVAYNAFANSGEAPEEAAISSDNDLYIGGDLEVDGTIYGSVSGASGSVAWDDITTPNADLTLSMAAYSTAFTWDPTADSAETAFTLNFDGEDTTGVADEDQVLLSLIQTSNGVDVDEAADALLTFTNNDLNDPVNSAIRFNAGAAGTDFTYGINFDLASIGTAELVLQNGETIDNTSDGTVLVTATTTQTSGNLTVAGTTGLTLSGVGGQITFANGETIDNDTDGSLTLTSPTTALSGDLTFTDDNWLGLGSAAGRIEFDNTATDELNFLDSVVGVGTSTPQGVVHIVKDSTYNGDTSAALTLGSSTTPAKRVSFGYDLALDAGYIQSHNVGTSAMPLILNAYGGNIGIGTGANATSALLDVRGGATKFIYDGTDVTQRGQVLVGAETDPNIAFQSAGEGLGFIGVDSSVDALVLGSSSTSDGGIRIRVGMSENTWPTSNLDGTDAVAILESGNVGIGSTAPDARLEINHATGDNLRLTYNDADGTAANYTDFSLSSSGDLTIDSSGGQVYLADTDTINIGGLTAVAYNALANVGEAPEEAAISSDNDLYIGGDLEVDGTIYGSVSGSSGSVAWDDITTPTASLTLSMAAYTTAFSWDSTGDANLFSLSYDNNGGVAGTDQVLVISNAVSTNIADDLNTEALLLLDQADTTAAGTTAVDNALLITNSGGSTLTDGIQIGTGTQVIANAINIGSTGVTTDIVLQNGETIDNNTDGTITLTATSTALSGDLAINGGNITTAVTADSTLTVTGTLTANGALDANGQVDLGDAGETATITSSDWTINATGDMTGIGAIGMDGDLTITQATPTIALTDSDGDDYTINANANAFTIVNATDARTELTFAGDGGITIGSATATAINLTTDSTGDAEVVLPNSSIGPNEVMATGQTDEYCLTYEATGTTWEWQTCGSGGGGAWSDITNPAGNLTLAMGVYNSIFNWDPGADSAETAFSLTIDGEDTNGVTDEDQVLLALSQIVNATDVNEAADALLTFTNNDANDPVENAIRFDAGGVAAADFTYGINFDAASIGTAELVLSNGETIANTVDGTVNIGTTTLLLTGGSAITTDQTTFSIADATVTTLNIGGAATAWDIGAATGTGTINNGTLAITGVIDANGAGTHDIAGTLNLSGGTLTATADLTVNVGGGQVEFSDTDTINIGGLTDVAYNAFANSGEAPEEAAIAADNDVYIGGDLEVDGTIYGGTDFTCADCLDFTDFEDTLDLDTDLILNQGTSTWTQNYTGTTGTGLSYVANSLTTGEAIDITAASSPTDGSTNEFIDINLTNSPGTLANASQGINLSLTDATALANTLYGTYVTVDNSANTSIDTHSIYGGYFTAAGKTAGTTTAIGLYASASGADSNFAGIFENGYVGIGTTTPSTTLHVKGADNVAIIEGDEVEAGLATGQLRIQGATNTNKRLILGYDTTTNFGFIEAGIAGTGYSNLILNGNASGSVGIGTEGPDAILDVLGTTEQLRLTYTDGSVFSSFTVDSSGDLTLNVSGTQVILPDDLAVNGDDITSDGNLTINATGYVRIGDTGTPITAADDDDDLYVQGDLETGGNIYLTGHNIYNVVGGSGTGTIVLATDPTGPGVPGDYNTLTYGAWLVQNATNNGMAALMVDQTKGGAIFSASSSGTTRFTIANDGSIAQSTVATTGTAYSLTADSLTTGTGIGISADGLTSGKAFYLESTSTALTSGSLASYYWNPGSATVASGDLFLINVGANALTTGNIFAIQDNASDLFTVSQAGITSALPHAFTAPGDVSVAYDLVFTNQTASKIEAYGPLTIEAGESFENNDLTVKTYGTGALVVDAAGGSEFTRSGNAVATFNRTTSDGTIISLQQAGTEEGTISVSTTTVSYNAFTGSHYAWSPNEDLLGRLDVVSLTTDNKRLHGNPESEVLYGVTRTTVENDPSVLGIYLARLESNKPQTEDNPLLVMAVGNADVWVAESANNVNPGDYLISSSVPGHAIKDPETYEVSNIIARAAEPIDWSTVNEYIGGVKHKRISVLFESFKVDRQLSSILALNESGQVAKFQEVYRQDVNRLENLIAATNQILYSIGENIVTGAIEAQSIATNSLTAATATIDNLLVTTGLVTPTLTTDLISPLDSGVVTIDGDLAAKTIYADQIVSPSLDETVTRAEVEEILRDFEGSQTLLNEANSWNVNTATSSGTLDELIATNLYVTGTAAITSLSVTESLGVGSDLVIQSGTDELGNLLGTAINTLTAPLKIQSLALAPVEIMAGRLTIATNGDVTIQGNLFVAGKVDAEELTLTESSEATESGRLLALKNKDGVDVGSIDASGSANFATLSTGGLVIANIATSSATPDVNGVIDTNATAGTAIIPEGITEITIKSPQIKNSSLVYVTPTSSTLNRVLYIKEKSAGYFVVGFSSPVSAEVNFNWWSIDVTSGI